MNLYSNWHALLEVIKETSSGLDKTVQTEPRCLRPGVATRRPILAVPLPLELWAVADRRRQIPAAAETVGISVARPLFHRDGERRPKHERKNPPLDPSPHREKISPSRVTSQ